MNPRSLLLLVFLFLSILSFPQITFQRTYGGDMDDYATSVAQLSDGGYILAGSTWSFWQGMEELCLVKTDAYGDTLWTRVFGKSTGYSGSGSSEQVLPSGDGGFIISSTTTSFGAGLQDCYVIRTNSEGVLLWSQTYGVTGKDYGGAICEYPGGGWILAGQSSSFGGNGDMLLLCIDTSGNVVWDRSIGGPNGYSVKSIRCTADHGFLLAGWTTYSSPDNANLFILKTDSLGYPVWWKGYGGPGHEEAIDVIPDDSGFMIAGTTGSYGAGYTDYCLIRTDLNGDRVWSKTYGGQYNPNLVSIRKCNDNGYIMGGTTYWTGTGASAIFLIRTNPDGDTLWTRSFNNSVTDRANSIVETQDGGFIICGQSIRPGTIRQDIFLIKTDSNGNTGCANEGTTFTVVSDTVIPQVNIGMIASTHSFTVTNAATETTSGFSVSDPCIPVGIPMERTSSGITITPNPFSESTMIRSAKLLEGATLEIYNPLGIRVVYRTGIGGHFVTIERGNLAAGLYFIQLRERGKVVGRGKVIVSER
jgi:hypothetical protein